MAEKKLNDLFVDTLKDIYYAEKQIFKSLPKMAKAAQNEELLISWAQLLGHDDAANILNETLTEEKSTDAALTKVAKVAVNAEGE